MASSEQQGQLLKEDSETQDESEGDSANDNEEESDEESGPIATGTLTRDDIAVALEKYNSRHDTTFCGGAVCSNHEKACTSCDARFFADCDQYYYTTHFDFSVRTKYCEACMAKELGGTLYVEESGDESEADSGDKTDDETDDKTDGETDDNTDGEPDDKTDVGTSSEARVSLKRKAVSRCSSPQAVSLLAGTEVQVGEEVDASPEQKKLKTETERACKRDDIVNAWNHASFHVKHVWSPRNGYKKQ